MWTWIVVMALGAVVVAGAEFPETQIANKTITAKLHLPELTNGSYQGTRFDWSGIIYSLEYKGHQYSGKWYEKHDAKGHDSITGPVEEFTPVGYEAAKPGDTFVRIGVGVLRRGEEKEYERFRTYDIVDPGTRSVQQGKDWIKFTHKLKGPGGYAYEYAKTVRLTKNGLVLEHALRNTGDQAIESQVYNHNFFVIDHQTSGPDMEIRFGFEAKGKGAMRGPGEVSGRQLLIKRPLEKGESVFTELEGFGTESKDYMFGLENKKAGAGVWIRGDQPLTKVVFWSIRTVACPEPYIAIKAEPGKTAKWTISYELY